MAHRIYIRQWRSFRRLKQTAVAEKTGLSRGSVSQIETGRQAYTRRSLEAIADALECPPGFLLAYNPTEKPKFWELWSRLNERQRQRATAAAMNHVVRQYRERKSNGSRRKKS